MISFTYTTARGHTPFLTHTKKNLTHASTGTARGCHVLPAGAGHALGAHAPRPSPAPSEMTDEASELCVCSL